MAVGVESRVGESPSKFNHGLTVFPISEAMTDPPLSHTAGLGLSTPEHTLLSSAEPGEIETHNPGQRAPPSPQQHSQKKRRTSKGKAPPDLRRSSSTPHMRNLALSNVGELSPTGDKRRNKLGYHRTSVACGHCRRRKIRCLTSNDDPQGRCENCIRLKKDCNFYPVEQILENQRSHSISMKEGHGPISATNSPRHSTTEKMDGFRTPSFSASASHTPATRFAMQSEVDVDPHQAIHSSGVHMQHPSYAYPPPLETQWSTPGFLPSSTVAEDSPVSSEYWRPSPSAPNSAYGSESNISAAQTPTTVGSNSHMSYGRPQDGHNWAQPSIPPPTRSMSYGNIEGLNHQFPHQNHGLGIQHHDYPRRASPYAYPTSIDTNTSSMHTTTLGSNVAAPLSAPILPNQPYGYPQAWNQFGGVLPPAHDVQGRSMSAQWYNEPGRLDRVQEENHQNVVYSQHQFYPGS